MFNVLEKIKQQSKSYLLYKQNLDNCLTTILLRKQKQSYRNTIASAINVVYAQNCKTYYFVRLKKELKTLKQVTKQLQAKTIKNSTFLSKAQTVMDEIDKKCEFSMEGSLPIYRVI